MKYVIGLIFVLALPATSYALTVGSQYSLPAGTVVCESGEALEKIESWAMPEDEAIASGVCQRLVVATPTTLEERGFFYSKVTIESEVAWTNTESLKPLDRQLIVEEPSEATTKRREMERQERQATAHERIRRGADAYRHSEAMRHEEAERQALERQLEAEREAEAEARTFAAQQQREQQARLAQEQKEACDKMCFDIYATCTSSCNTPNAGPGCTSACGAAFSTCKSRCR